MWQVDLFLMKAQWSQTKDTLWLNESEKIGDRLADLHGNMAAHTN